MSKTTYEIDKERVLEIRPSIDEILQSKKPKDFKIKLKRKKKISSQGSYSFFSSPEENNRIVYHGDLFSKA